MGNFESKCGHSEHIASITQTNCMACSERIGREDMRRRVAARAVENMTSRACMVLDILRDSEDRLNKREITARMGHGPAHPGAWVDAGIKELRDAGLIDWNKNGFTEAPGKTFRGA